MKNFSYFAAAYLIFWVGNFFYLWLIERRQKEINQALQAISSESSSDQ